MKAIILAAGYATRLYPYTEDKPKALLQIGDRNILEHIFNKLERVKEVEQVYIVTNRKFYNHFQDWTGDFSCSKKIKILNDNTTSNEDRLGAIADLSFAVEEERIDEDIFVLAGDNLFEFELSSFVNFYKAKNADCITCHQLDDMGELRKTGIVEIDRGKRVLSFEEKPNKPRSNLAVPPFYIYKKETLPLLKKYLAEGNNPDAPGNFIPWLIKKKNVYAYQFDGYRYDIGTVESYKKVKALFEQDI